MLQLNTSNAAAISCSLTSPSWRLRQLHIIFAYDVYACWGLFAIAAKYLYSYHVTLKMALKLLGSDLRAASAAPLPVISSAPLRPLVPVFCCYFCPPRLADMAPSDSLRTPLS